MTIVCRTVLDLRSPLDKYICQTILLVASWHRYCADHSRLEVLTIGRANPLLSDFLDRLGVHHAAILPSPNDQFSKSSNKIEAAYPDPKGRRVLLLDNDVCFFGSIRELNRLPETAIAASEPGSLRVSDAQWALIGETLGIPLLRRRFTAINELAKKQGLRADGRDHKENFLYLNSGVILFPAGHDHRPLWRTHQRRIHDYFRDHPLRSDAVTTSDQAGFATSVAAYGDFTWLPLRFNYRRACFGIGLETPDQIGIVHLTGDIRNGQQLGLSQRVHAYWNEFVLPWIGKIPESVTTAEKRRRNDVALAVQASALAIIHEYALEDWLDEYRGFRQRSRLP